MMLMSDTQHKKVGNLDKKTVKKLDKLVKYLMLDTNKCLYSARTRLNDQTGHTVKCIFYGKSAYVNQTYSKTPIFAAYPNDFADEFTKDMYRFTESLKIKLSPSVQAVLNQQIYFGQTQARPYINLGMFLQNKNHSQFAELMTHQSEEEPAMVSTNTLVMAN